MQKLLIGLVVGVVVGVGVGYALYHKPAEEPAKADTVDKDRGEWPDMPSPPDQPGPEIVMASQRLSEIIGKAPPPDVVTAVMDCWMEVHTPESGRARSIQVFNAWNLSNAEPIDWPAVKRELEPHE
jgi:hypothetical protein